MVTLEDQPLMVLYKSDAVRQLTVPQLFAGGRVCVTGVPYKRDLVLDDLVQQLGAAPDRNLGITNIAVVHAYASLKGGMFFDSPVLKYGDLVAACPHIDVWVFGHWHIDQGIECIDGKLFVNVGAVSRGALRDEPTERIPKVGLIEVDTDTGLCAAREIPLLVRPAEEVFAVAKRDELRRENEAVERFVSRLREQAAVSSVGDIRDAVLKMEAPDAVRERALDYLRECGVD
jgi:hypothetical protein